MRLEVWGDIICPWCGLGNHRMRTALERFAHADSVEVVHRSYQLDPTAPEGVVVPVDEYLRRKGIDPRGGLHIERMAHAEGIADYHVAENETGNTGLAHEFLAFASSKGLNERAWQFMWDAHFGRRVPVWSVDDLAALAPELDLDEAEARDALTSRRYRPQVMADLRDAYDLGVQGVPFIAINRRYGISGARDADTVLAALERAWRETVVAG